MQENKNNMNQYLEKGYVMENVIPCLRPIGTGKENDYSEKYIDMELYYRVTVPAESGQIVSFVVTKQLMIALGLFPEDLRRVAEANARENAKITTMENFFASFMWSPNEYPEEAVPLYIVTNADTFNGAGVAICPEVLDRIAKETEARTLIVIPSSIHEILVMPVTDSTPGISEVNRIIKLVNSTVLKEEDLLSDHCYIYNAQTKNLFYKAA